MIWTGTNIVEAILAVCEWDLSKISDSERPTATATATATATDTDTDPLRPSGAVPRLRDDMDWLDAFANALREVG